MKLKTILTDRHYQCWPSWHIVYEWEDELSRSLNLPLVNTPVPNGFLTKNFKRVDNKLFNGNIGSLLRDVVTVFGGCSLYFEMHPTYQKTFSNGRKTIPIIIDFWDKPNIGLFKKIYASCPSLLITSLEVVNFLKENDVSNNVIHFPMSLPSIYSLRPGQSFEKKYDIVLAGRTNPVMWEYLQQFETTHRDIEYLYQVLENGELYYKSNKQGIIGKFQSRSAYIDLVKSAKVSFYATPGIDGGEKRTNGFNPVTPRFFELLFAGCHVLARYPKNSETEFFKLETLCPSTDTYEEFSCQLEAALDSPLPIERNAKYLNDHYTSNRVKIIGGLL